MNAAGKICTLERLLSLREEARRAGRVVVHCHGCFDIVHPGHIQHLQFARSLGDVLLVSVSADACVNKGPDRPLIPEDLRAMSLAALECVDWVYVNRDPTAVELLEQVRPDIYVKGREYERNNDPRFLAERDTVLRHGGRVVFSGGEVVYSSTALIGQIGQRELFDLEKLRRLRQRCNLDASAVRALMQRFDRRRVVVAGDCVVEYCHECEICETGAEDALSALRVVRTHKRLRGAAAVAIHAAALGASPVLVTQLADDAECRETVDQLERAGVQVTCMPGRAPLRRHRYVVDDRTALTADGGGPVAVDSRIQEAYGGLVLSQMNGAAALVVADHGQGLLTPPLLKCIIEGAASAHAAVVGRDAGIQGSLKAFRGVDMLVQSEREVRRCLHDYASGVGALAWNLLHMTGARSALMIIGRKGLLSFETASDEQTGRLHSEYAPVLAPVRQGGAAAYDRLLAVAALVAAAGGSPPVAALLGASAMEVEEDSRLSPDVLAGLFDFTEQPCAMRRAS